jgi:hypothetical protein
MLADFTKIIRVNPRSRRDSRHPRAILPHSSSVSRFMLHDSRFSTPTHHPKKAKIMNLE